MGKYRSMRKCKEIGEVAVMTRARAAASVSARAGRKRKVRCSEELSSSSRSLVQKLRSRRRLFVSTPENSTEKAASSNCNDQYASCCSSNGSIELDKDTLKFVDLEEEEESVEVATSTYELEWCTERRETIPSSSEVRVESADMDSTARPSLSQQANSHPRSTDEKMPTQAELEEFFSKAEKHIHQQFEQKYNFDVVKEEPLEGRYEWVPVKP